MGKRFLRVLVRSVVCSLVTLCASCCDSRIVSQKVSPSGEMVATVTTTHCGPPGGDSSGVTIRPLKKLLFARRAVVCGADDIYSIGVGWKDDHTLVVDLPKEAFGSGLLSSKLVVQNFDVNGVHIEYRSF